MKRYLGALLLGGFLLTSLLPLSLKAAPYTPVRTRVALEGVRFSFPGTHIVRFGKGARYVEKRVSTTGLCTNSFFGRDPAPYTKKQCTILKNKPKKKKKSGSRGSSNSSSGLNTAVNGTCGSSHGQSFTSAPSASLCGAGTASTVTGTGPWSWNCAGLSGGTEVACETSGVDLDRSSGIRGFSLAGSGIVPRVEQDYADLAAYGANIARIGVDATLNGSGAFELATSEWDYMQLAVDMGRKYGFKVVITLSPTPNGQDAIYWDRTDLKANLVDIWTQIATQYNGDPVIAGYDLINEPVQPKDRNIPVGSTEYWRPLATDMITAIRAVDPNVVIIFEPSPWGAPVGFWPSGVPLVPLPFSRMVYSFHFYDPHELTHQGLPGYSTVINYPTTYPYTKAYLSDVLQYVRLFTAAYPEAPVYMGEFGMMRSAPGNSTPNWLTDVIDLVDAEGWNWTYHAFREYQGWDSEIELGPIASPGPRSAIATTISLLKAKGFSLNSLFNFAP